jgi:hypothetical protein
MCLHVLALVLEFSVDVRAHVVGKPEKECTITTLMCLHVLALVLEFSADVRAHVVDKPEKECTLTTPMCWLLF